MPLGRAQLLDFLEIVEQEVKRKITLVAAGGTAMTLLNLKPSSIDIDFTGPGDDISEFKRALRGVPHGFKVDLYKDGAVFSQLLPEDYVEKSIRIKQVGRLELRALHPLDIVVTKIGRLNERDMEDIESCVKKFRPSRSQVLRRARQVAYVGRERNYEINLQFTLNRLFGKRTSTKGR